MPYSVQERRATAYPSGKVGESEDRFPCVKRRLASDGALVVRSTALIGQTVLI